MNYFNPAFSWYESLFGPADFQRTLNAFPIVLQGSGAIAPFTTIVFRSRSVDRDIDAEVESHFGR